MNSKWPNVMASHSTSTSRLWGCVRSLSVLLIVVATATAGCAAQAIDRPGSAPTMSPPVLALYNEGAAAFRAGEFAKAKEKHEAALDKARALGDQAGIGACLAGLGGVYQALQEYPKALESFSAALPYLARTGNLPAQAWAYGAIGEVRLQMGDHAKAVEAFDEGLALAEKVLLSASEQEKLAMLPIRGIVLGEKAVAHEKLGQFNEAVASYRRAAVDFEAVGDKWKQGIALWLAGTIVHTKMEKPAEAIQLLLRASHLLDESGKVVDVAWARSELAWAHLELAQYEQAQTVATALVEVAVRERIPELVFQGYFIQGRASESIYQYEQAIRHYEAALESLRGGEQKADPRQIAAVLWLKGKLHRLLSQYGEAVEHFYAAVVRYRQIQDPKNEAEALVDLAEVFFWLADHRAATKYYKQAFDIYRVIGDLPKQVKMLALLAVASWLGEETPADVISGYLQEGATLVNSVRDAVGFDPVTRLGEAHRKTEQKFLSASSQLVVELKERMTSFGALDLYAAAYVTFLIKESKNTFEDWQAKVLPLGMDYLMAAGTLHQQSGVMSLWSDPVVASEYFTLAHIYHTSIPYNRDLGFEWAKDWFYLGESYRRQGKFDLALLLFYKAKMMGFLLGSPEIHWVYAGLAQTYADMGNAATAVIYYTRALELLEAVQGQQGTEEFKIGVLEGALYFYRNFVALLLDLHAKTGDARLLHSAFETTERLRARAFLEMLGRSQVTRLGGDLASLAEKGEEIRRQIAQIHQRLRAAKLPEAEESRLLDQVGDLRKSWREHQRQTAKQSKQYAQIIVPHPVTVAQVQSVLDPETVLLEYSVASEASTLWVITKDEIHGHTLPGVGGLSILEDYLRTLRGPLFGAEEVSQHLALGWKLYRTLLGPAEPWIRSMKHLIIAPDGPLYYLPFEALIIPGSLDGQDGAKPPGEIPYLVKSFRITYVPSASVLVTQRRARETQQPRGQLPLVAFGDPIYDDVEPIAKTNIPAEDAVQRSLRGSQLRPLEFSAEEVRRIARIWGVPLESPHINLGHRATLARVRELDLSRYRVLHFATHGLAGDEIGWTTQPALVLSQVGDGKDHLGLLQLGDILNLRLQADLVVLSACNTGLGKLREGEGIVGLTRAFMYAGASSVVVSLWRVEDQSTSLLMERFYKRLKQGQGKAEALRQAKLELMQETIELKATGMREQLASPFYWAPFILVGEAH